QFVHIKDKGAIAFGSDDVKAGISQDIDLYRFVQRFISKEYFSCDGCRLYMVSYQVFSIGIGQVFPGISSPSFYQEDIFQVPFVLDTPSRRIPGEPAEGLIEVNVTFYILLLTAFYAVVLDYGDGCNAIEW